MHAVSLITLNVSINILLSFHCLNSCSYKTRWFPREQLTLCPLRAITKFKRRQVNNFFWYTVEPIGKTVT